MNGLSVIIPSRTISNIHPCTRAVHHLDKCDTIVVWDRSRGNCQLVPEPHFRVREVEATFIYARNCNIGICAAGDNDVVLLNGDAILRTVGGFTALQRAAEDNRDYGIIGAVTNITAQPLQTPHGIGLRHVPHFAFVCVFIPRRTIREVGFLDERYCLDYGVEDRDYCEMVNRAGLKCGVFDDCYVDHASLRSSFRGAPRGSRSFAQNWRLFQKKWGNATI